MLVPYDAEMLECIKNNNGVDVDVLRNQFPESFDFHLAKILDGGYAVQEGRNLRFVKYTAN